MKKLLYLPLLYQGGNEQYDLYKAFSKVYEVAMIDHLNEPHTNELLEEKVRTFQPDIVHMQVSDKIDLNMVKRLRNEFPGILWTQWTGDCRAEPLPLIVKFGQVIDATLLASGLGQKKLYEQRQVKNVRYLQHAVADWQFIEPLPMSERKGIVMIANNYDQHDPSGDRLELAQKLSDTFEDFIVYGSGWPDSIRHGDPIPWVEQGITMNKAFITVGTNGINTVPGYWSDRPYIALAAGSPHLTRAVPSCTLPLLEYNTLDEAVHQIRTARIDPVSIESIMRLGQLGVMKHDTFDHRVMEYRQIVAEL
jgi:hypothetical protein